MQGQNEEREPK